MSTLESYQYSNNFPLAKSSQQHKTAMTLQNSWWKAILSILDATFGCFD